MQISNLRISGFRSFGLDVVDIPLVSKMSTFIGLNSSGKTTALEALSWHKKVTMCTSVWISSINKLSLIF